MPKPPYPIDGDPIVAGWGKSLTDFAAEKWYYTPSYGGTFLSNAVGDGTIKDVENVGIPADDPDIVGMMVSARLVDTSGGDNGAITLYDWSGLAVGAAYTSGVQDRGGASGPYLIIPGGPGNRSMHWNSPAGMTANLWPIGYYKRTPPAELPPYPAEGDPISSAWAKSVLDIAGRKLSYRSTYLNFLNAVQGSIAPKEYTFTEAQLPLDPRIKAVSIIIMCRDGNGTQNISHYVHHGDGTTAGFGYSSGVQSRAGIMGPYYTRLGGTNGRSIQWHTSQEDVDTDFWAYLMGYYVEDDPA